MKAEVFRFQLYLTFGLQTLGANFPDFTIVEESLGIEVRPALVPPHAPAAVNARFATSGSSIGANMDAG